jgi:DNA-binding winged helix-turn-helix (wHTH) protein/TolB-like protein
MDPDRAAYRFAQFVFDPASGELKDVDAGSLVARLQPQVAALLTALVEQSGTVVSRAELRARLWPDTTVDFDDGLNFCIRQLRLALGDEANNPRFVETLARRGYRFIAPVSRVSGNPPTLPATRSARNRVGLVMATILLVATGALIVGRVMGASNPPVRTGFKLAVVPFMVDSTDSLMTAYQRQLLKQVNGDVSGRPEWDVVTDTIAATHVLSGALKRRGFSVEVFVQLVRRSSRRHLWADSILDSYAFSGNSTLTADRIARSVSRLLQTDTASVRRP